MSDSTRLIGYGPRSRLMFTGEETEYDLWEVRFLGYMQIQNLKATILSVSETVDADKNERAYSELVQLLDEKSLSMIMTDASDDGRKALKLLRSHYKGTSKPRILTIYTNLCNLHMADGEDLTAYVSRAERLGTSLKSAGETVSDTLLTAMLMKGLPDRFGNFIVFITQSEKEYSFADFKMALRSYFENERSRHPDTKDSIMKSAVKYTIKCYGCRKDGHYAKNCPTLYCSHCKVKGHKTDDCRKQSKVKSAVERQDDEHHYAFKASAPSNVSDGFMVDTGATSHIVNDPRKFVTFNQNFNADKHTIELADGSTSNAAKHRGTVNVLIRDDNGKICDATLNNSLYVPDYPTNIFSVNAATENGATVTFDEKGAQMTTKDGNTFSIEKHGKLYYLPTIEHVDRAKSIKEYTLKELHCTMGHCNTSDLVNLEGVVQGIRIKDPNSTFFCDTCCKGKLPHSAINRLPDKRAVKPLELVHTDLSGPVTPIAKDGFQYCISFVDDYSGMVFYYFLRNKSDATRATETFLADVAPIGVVKTLRSDSGGEYMGSFKDLLLKHSIRHETCSPHSPHQNGTAERNWRTGYDMARCLLIDSGLPKFLWTYAIATSGYIRNRCFQKRTGSTPYEIFTGRKPNIQNMVPFGTRCFMYVEDKRKLDNRSQQCAFIGYDRQSPAYLLYDEVTRSVRRSRNVKFDVQSALTALCDPPSVEDIVVLNKEDVVQNKVARDVIVVQNKNARDDIVVLNKDVQQDDVVQNIAQVAQPNPAQEGMPIQDQAPGEVDEDRPRRTRKLPKYLAENYILDNKIDDSIMYNKDICIVDDTIDYCYKMYVDRELPSSYKEAITSPDSKKWCQAMQEEINALKDNDTWSIEPLPKDKNLVSGKWVFTVKLNKDNEIIKYKARYVARGFTQIQGIDYIDTFSPTARMTTLRVLMQIVSECNLIVHQLDVKTAYLNAKIDADIYLEQPEGFVIPGNNVCHLKKSIYGLKQSGRNWNITINTFFESHNFSRSNIDHCLYIYIC